MEEQDHDDRYSQPLYYDSVHQILVNEQYEPVELPSTQRPLHGGEYGFDSPGNECESGEQQKIPRTSNPKFIKYKGLQLKDDLSIATFQRFKAE